MNEDASWMPLAPVFSADASARGGNADRIVAAILR
jgi:hypothetical protein